MFSSCLTFKGASRAVSAGLQGSEEAAQPNSTREARRASRACGSAACEPTEVETNTPQTEEELSDLHEGTHTQTTSFCFR